MENLTRTQRRQLDRINRQAESVYKRLCEQFYTVFLDNDPDGDIVKQKEAEVLAKWKMYANSRKFTDQAKAVLKVYIETIRKEYNDAKVQG